MKIRRALLSKNFMAQENSRGQAYIGFVAQTGPNHLSALMALTGFTHREPGMSLVVGKGDEVELAAMDWQEAEMILNSLEKELRQILKTQDEKQSILKFATSSLVEATDGPKNQDTD